MGVKCHEMSIEKFLEVYEQMNKEKLTEAQRKNVTRFATEFSKFSLALPKDQLLIMKKVKKLQIEILDAMECDQLRIYL
jgi:hypothetical protein